MNLSIARERFVIASGCSITTLLFFLFIQTLIVPGVALARDAIAYGTPGCGRLEGGVPLPCTGENFRATSPLVCMLGRNYVHPMVREILLSAYAELEGVEKPRHWIYGDTGHQEGKQFWPHHTHQHGLSVDFFFPVDEKSNLSRPAVLPTTIFTGLGYAIDFSNDGYFEEYTISWSAMADHLLALKKLAGLRGATIKRIILAPPLREQLLKREPRTRALAHLFSRSQAWFRHDEHYHVDFELPRKFRRPYRCE